MALETASLAADEDVAAETESLLDSAKAEAPPRDGFRTALGLPVFRRLWLAQLLGQLGEAVALVAMPLFVYALTGSAELLSLIFVLQLLPRVVLAPIAGMLADRLDRRRIILGMNLARAGLVAALPFTTQTWQIAVLATLVAIGNTIAQPAELAAVPAVVPPGLLVPALSASQVARSVVRVVGPTLAAGIIAFTGPGPAFGVQAVCFLVAAGIVYGLVLPPVARQPRTTSTAAAMSQEILDGLRTVWRTPVVRGLAAAESLWQLVFASLVVTLLVYVQESLHLGDRAATTYSLLMAAFGGGAAVGALIARPVERRIGRPRLMAIGYLAPLTLMPALLTPPLPVLFACWLALGFTDSWAVIAMQTYLAEAVPDAMRGRVYATWFGVVTLAGAIAFVVIGWLTPRLGPPQTLALVGAVVGIGGPLLLLATGAVASLRHDAAAERRGPPSAFEMPALVLNPRPLQKLMNSVSNRLSCALRSPTPSASQRPAPATAGVLPLPGEAMSTEPIAPPRRVRVLRYVTPLREGGSLPAIVEADDDGMYVVKFRGAGQGPKALVAELLAAQLGQALGLPVPETVLVELDPALGMAEPDPEIQELLERSAGLNVGIDYLPGSLPLGAPAGSGVSPDLAASVVWFDALLQNVDRTPRNPNLLLWHRNLWLIDHGAALYTQHGWTGNLDAIAAGAQARFPAIRDHVLLPIAGSILDADHRLAPHLSAEVITQAVAAIPGELLEDLPPFATPDQHRAAYETHLTRRLAAPRGWVEEAEEARRAQP